MRSPQDLDGSLSGAIVGRERELETLRGALDRALDGRGTLVALVGEAGLGKSRLARRLSAEARDRGALVATARGWETGGAPVYWPWIQVVRDVLAEVPPDELREHMGEGAPLIGRMIPDLGSASDDTAPVLAGLDQDRFALFDALLAMFRSLARTRPLAIVLEDIHDADGSSLSLLRFVARGLTAAPVLLVTTHERNRRDPTSSDLLEAAVADGHVVTLDPLDRGEIASLYSSRVGEPPSEGELDLLQAVGEGNPLFTHEAITMLTSNAELQRPDHSLGFKVPAGAKHVLRRRLETLDAETTRILLVAAVIGRDFSASILEGVAATSGDVLSNLESALGAGVVTEVGGRGRYSFTHILMRESLYEDLTAADRMRLHFAVGQALEAHYGPHVDEHLAEVAHHFYKAAQAGDDEKAIDYLRRAAQNAFLSAAYEEAVRLGTRALQVAESGAVNRQYRSRIRSEIAAARGKMEESQAASAEVEAVDATQKVFRQRGEVWEVGHPSSLVQLKDSKGLAYLAHLLRNQGVEIHVLDLVSATTPGKSSGPSMTAAVATAEGLDISRGDAGDILDAAARSSYRARLSDLLEEVEEAESFNDTERAARARYEIDALTEQLAGAVGLGGRSRKAASVVERARTSVRHALKSAISRIAEHQPALGHHLTAHVRTGTYCSYVGPPGAEDTWSL